MLISFFVVSHRNISEKNSKSLLNLTLSGFVEFCYPHDRKVRVYMKLIFIRNSNGVQKSCLKQVGDSLSIYVSSLPIL